VRRPIAIFAALVMAAAIAAPAQAATLHRTFNASVGSNGVAGKTKIEAFTDGSGRVTYDLKNLRSSAKYRIEIRKGRCGNLGTVVTRFAEIRTTRQGNYAALKSLSVTKMNTVWQANWKNRLAIRFVNGTSVRCGNLNFTAATRVRIPQQDVLGRGIDLAVVRSPNGYPYCNVAMYMGALNQPTEPGVTFIYAHARKGMFLPLLNEWNQNRGSQMIGMKVYVWTSNNIRHTYVIDKVWKSKTMDGVFKTNERLWLQTSTGPNFTYPKLFLEGRRVASEPSSWTDAHPTARIVRC
jgi:hypothetical protein